MLSVGTVIYFLSSKNHYRLMLALLSNRYLLIIHINSKDGIKCMLNVNQDAKLMTRETDIMAA